MTGWFTIITLAAAIGGGLIVVAAATGVQRDAGAMLENYEAILRSARQNRRPPNPSAEEATD